MNRLILVAMLGTIVPLIITGCGTNTAERIAVSGVVTLDGEPLSDGRINFTPAKGNLGPAAGAAIKDGSYDIPAANGPVAGVYSIVVTTGGPPRKQPSPESQPAIESQTFRFTRTIVGDDGETKLSFDL